MDRLIYTALTGLGARQAAQAATANNLANAAVPGFRREYAEQAARWLTGAAPGELSARAGSTERIAATSTAAGPVADTGNPLDVALDGRGWLAVADAAGGEAWTRRGDLRAAATGLLETGDGRPVLGIAGTIAVPPGAVLRIGPDGTVSLRTADGSDAPLDRLKLADPPGLAKGRDGLMRTAAPVAPDASLRLRPAALEGSNQSAAAALIELVEQSRGFETGAKLLAAARDIDEAGARLMRLDG